MYKVLYRKYRPAVFSDVFGQPQVTDILKKQIKTGRLAHAYLFTGSRGIGKTTCARILAKAVNCLHPVDGDPCNECEICRGIEDETIHDVVEMDAASNNGVNDVRSLQETLAFPPARAKYRVFIIDEVHMMSREAFNALLKTLEEPPENVLFILATTEAHEIPATILSRCQRMNFRRIPAEVIAERLTDIAHSEHSDIDRAAALLIGRIADGGMRDAISLLDQCLAREREVTEETVRRTAGLAGQEHLAALSGDIREKNSAGVIVRLGELHAMSKDMLRLCEELISYYRSLMIISTVQQPEGLIIATGEQLAALREDAKNYTLPRILGIIDALQDALERMGRGADRRTELELALLRICRETSESTEKAAVPPDLERRLAELEKAVRSGAVQPAPKKAAAPDLPQATQKIVELSDKAKPFTQWSDIIALLEKKNTSLFAVLNGSHGFIADDYILIRTTDYGIELLRLPTPRENLKSVITEVTGRQFKIGPYRPSADTKAEERSPSDALVERLEKSGIDINNTDK